MSGKSSCNAKQLTYPGRRIIFITYSNLNPTRLSESTFFWVWILHCSSGCLELHSLDWVLTQFSCLSLLHGGILGEPPCLAIFYVLQCYNNSPSFGGSHLQYPKQPQEGIEGCVWSPICPEKRKPLNISELYQGLHYSFWGMLHLDGSTPSDVEEVVGADPMHSISWLPGSHL